MTTKQKHQNSYEIFKITIRKRLIVSKIKYLLDTQKKKENNLIENEMSKI